MNIGDLFLTLLADGSRLEGDVIRQADAAAAKAGQVAGASLATSMGRSFTKAGKNLDTLGSSLSRNLTLPLVGAGAAITLVGKDFDTTLRQIVALTDVTADEIGGVREEILALAPALGRSPQELAEGFYFLASAGFDTSEALTVLRSTAKAAATGLGTTADISKVVGAAINAFGKENLTAEDAVDQLIRAINAGTAEAPEFAGALGDVLGTAGQLGSTFADASAAIAAMTLKGISADEAATSLNQVFTSLIKTTPQAEEGFAAVGTSSEKLRAIIREKGLLAALQELAKRFEGSDTAAAAAFGNVRALRGVLALTGGDAAKTADIFNDVAGGTQNLGDAFKETEGPGRRMDRALAKIQVALIRLSDDVLPIVARLFEQTADVVGDVVGFFKGLPEPVREGVVQFLALAAALGPVALVSGKVAKGLGSILSVVGKVADRVGLRMMTRVAEEVASSTAEKVIAEAAAESVGGGLTKAGRMAAIKNAAIGLGTSTAAMIGMGLAAGIAVLAVAKMVGDQVEAQKADLAKQVGDAIETQTIDQLRKSAKVIRDQLESQKILGVIPFEFVNERSGPNGLDAQLKRLEDEIANRMREMPAAAAQAFREGERQHGVGEVVQSALERGVAAMAAAIPKMTATARAAGKAIPDSVAAGVLAKQNAPVEALDTLKMLMKNALTPTQTVARNIGILTSKALAKGLADKRPAVRAEAKRVQAIAEKELAEAILAGGKVGKQAAQKLAEGLKSKNPKVRAESRRVQRIVTQQLAATKKPAGDAGAAAGAEFVRRLRNAVASGDFHVNASVGFTIPGRARGGPIRAGVPYAVNEDTPRTEFIVPSTSGHVLTHADAMRAVADSGSAEGGDTINLTVPVTGILRAERPSDVARSLRALAETGVIRNPKRRRRVEVPTRSATS